jgi:hypothetical protein
MQIGVEYKFQRKVAGSKAKFPTFADPSFVEALSNYNIPDYGRKF